MAIYENILDQNKDELYIGALDVLQSHIDFAESDIKALYVNVKTAEIYVELHDIYSNYNLHYIYNPMTDTLSLKRISGGN